MRIPESIGSMVAAAMLTLAFNGCAGTAEVTGTGGASAGGAAGSAAVGGSGGVSGTSIAGSGACNPACGTERTCCANECANLQNDPKNCGSCGKVCTGTTYCGGGQCIEPPCTATCTSGQPCCGSSCCSAGQLCCDPQGPLDTEPRCTAPSDTGTCPMGCAPLCICASPDTPIATPFGEIPIADLRVGDLVYSADGNALRAVPIIRTHRTPVRNHSVVRVTLASGRTLEISAGHPTADGRTFADLRQGGSLDQVTLASVAKVPYTHEYTYDILPASETGTYVAAGVLIGSTLNADP